MKYKRIFTAIIFFLFSSNLFAAAGDLDLTFAPTGITTFSVVNDVVVQPDGKILVAGVFFSMNGAPAGRIARLNADGSTDATFAPAGGANGDVSVIALQADGKIVIAGNFTSVSGTAMNRIARLNPDGTLDMTFTIGLGFNAIVQDIAVQPLDGKIVAGGGISPASTAR